MPRAVPFGFDQRHLTVRQRGPLRLGQWLTHSAKGQLVLLPGRGDFLEKYTPLATFLNMHGYSVTSLDWPGQGASGRLGQHPQAGHIHSYDDYVEALQVCLEVYGLEDKPQVWAAYSMGAPIALQTLLEHTYPVQGLVLLSPAFGFTGLPEGTMNVLVSVALRLGLSRHFALGEGPTTPTAWRIEGSQVSSSPEAFTAFQTFLQRHPDYLIGGSTWGWVGASLEVFKKVRRAGLSQLQLPILLLSAQDELTVSRKAQQRFMQRLPNTETVNLPGKHDLLLNEPGEVEKVFRYIADFLDQTSLASSP